MSQTLLGSQALGSAHGWVTTKICAHPSAVAITLAVLILLVIILFITTMVYYRKWKDATPAAFRSGFKTAGPWANGGMNPMWQNGSVHGQAYFGEGLQHYSQLGNVYQPAVHSTNSLHSTYKGRHHMAVAAHRAAAHRAAVKRMQGKRMASMRRSMHRREGLAAAGVGPTIPTNADGSCPDDYTPVTDPNGNTMCTWTYGPLSPTTGYEGDEGGDWVFDPSACPSTGTFDPVSGVMTVDTQTIGDVWDPDAIAEAQALASVGSYVNDPSGDEMAFQAAIGSAYDANSAANTLSDAQLQAIMKGGTAP